MDCDVARLLSALLRRDGVIFDLDGVIMVTDEMHYRAWKQLSDDEGWDFNHEVNHKLRGVSRLKSLDIILEHNGISFSDKEKIEFAERKNDYYRAMLRNISDDDMMPGARAFIQSLRRKGMPMAIASGSRNAEFAIERLNLAPLFDAIVSGNDDQPPKPDPSVFILAAQRMNAEGKRCAVFEDASAGIEAARAGGMLSIGVGDAERLPNADFIVANFIPLHRELGLFENQAPGDRK